MKPINIDSIKQLGKKTYFLVFILSIILGLIAIYLVFYLPNIDQEKYYLLQLKEDTPFSEVYDKLNKNAIKYPLLTKIFLHFYSIKTVKAGSYRIQNNMGNLAIFRKLKYGFQDPINFTISSATFIEEIARRVGKTFLIDSAQFLNTVNSPQSYIEFGYNAENALAEVYPYTYEIYWNASAKDIWKKIRSGKTSFWTSERKAALSKLNISETELYIIASMVQKEYYKKEERSRIAGVLMNRLAINMPLQIDATCKYATRDFGAKRVLNYHTQFSSPYNTYLNIGLPPGPICIPELGTLEDCLKPEKHNYIYYCADPSLNGYHIFNETLEGHELVAKNYRSKITEMKIK